ncbi:unnamed protein product [Mycena citricolor]|uniref:Alfy-like armadillo-like repeat domain-containing protein n=1 Tax=Mycena citricolor TaxID=2018698 RepID=A0AAD2K1D2_9AGAR|nr:unnamed protein product [Mycena citricolor]
MFRTLLTPLRLRFDSSPRSAVTQNIVTPIVAEEDELENPEDFARDVLVELMRNSVEKLKMSQDTHSRMETLVEIQRIMLQDSLSATKDVFREMDGFVGLMSVLSAAHEGSENADEAQLGEIIECSRLAFMITSEAMTDHPDNTQYFKVRCPPGFLALNSQVLDDRFLLPYCRHCYEKP